MLLEHVPSGKITIGLYSPFSSSAFCRPAIKFNVLVSASGVPPRGTKMQLMDLATNPKRGHFFKKSPATNETFPFNAQAIAGPSKAEQWGTK